MKNLVLLGEKRRSAAVGSTSNPTICSLCRVPTDDGTETVLLTTEGMLIQVTEENDLQWVCNLNESCEGMNDGHEWFNVTFVDPEIVCLSTCGAIVTVSPSNGHAQVVGEFDHGLEAAQWSPDREVLALVTFVDNEEGGRNSVLLSMNAQWEVLAEVNIEPHSDNSQVSLCWRPDATLCAVSTLDVADQTRRIRTYKRETLELHSIGRSEDGSGKVVPNLGSALSWAGGGCSNLVTSIQQKGKRTQQVVFFEPNGLRHREFALRPEQPDAPHATVLILDWNVESDLLAVTLREETHDKVQLWHRSNYHWYLKQELRYGVGEIACTKFDDEQAYILYVGLSGNGYAEVLWREYEFRWDTSTLYTMVEPSSSQSCTALSIDGCLLNLTPLDKALVPPPMYAASLTMARPIREVAFAVGNSANVAAIVYLSDGSFAILADRNEGESQLIANYTPPSVIGKAMWTETQEVDVTSLRQFLIIDSSDLTIVVVAIACGTPNEHHDRLVELRIDYFEGGDGSVSLQNTIMLESHVLRMVHWLDNADGALLELDDGSLLEYTRDESGEGRVLPSESEPLLEPCPWIGALHDASVFGQEGDTHRERLVVGLSSRNRLYCHDRLLAEAASSFILSPPHQFLCYATAGARSILRFLPLKELHNFDPLMGSDENILLEGYEPRNVERGTRLVAVLPQNPMAILQMPRGNMEGTYPRALVLPFVMSLIDNTEYGKAFSMMRRQKVDLNLIVDLNPRYFLESGIDTFLEEVIPVDHLNLFISCLQDEDITKFRHQIPSWLHRPSGSPAADVDEFDFATKVNQVCQKLRIIMIQAEQDGRTKAGRAISDGHFLLPVLSTFAKESPPKLEEALTLIKENALALHPPTSRKPPLFSEKAQSSIHYLAFLADYELLFNTALGMYDYDLARAVARNSQMDPKIYLPLLKRLKSCPEYYGKYEVDMRLQRYEAAFSNLVESQKMSEDLSAVSVEDPAQAIGNDFEQCMTLVESHGLHRLGLELFQSDPDKHRQILLSLGNQLLKKRQAETALAVFLAADPPHLEGARQAARESGDWQFFFTVPADSNDNDESTSLRNRQIAREIAEEIAAGKNSKSSKREALVDAARILLEYCQDIVGSVDMLISAEKWSEARRVASLHSRQDLVKKCVDACVLYAFSCLEDFEERTASFTKTNQRYIEVLEIRKVAIRESGLAPGEEHDANIDDSGSLFSMASNASFRSNMSGSSVGSVSSTVSSVISVGAQSTFSVTSELDLHRSKFNKSGKKEKKKKKKTGRSKIRPGSEEELKNLVGTLKYNCVDSDYCEIIADTISFLGQVGKLDLAREVFAGYNAMKTSVAALQEERIDLSRKAKVEHERKARREGVDEPFLELNVEQEVDLLECCELPATLHELFSYL